MPVIWTAQSVRDKLPTVHVLWNGKKYTGRVSGRMEHFALVGFQVGDQWVAYEWSWDAIANSLNKGTSLIA